MPVGFIGIGNMGLPMAEKLIEAGEQLVVHDARAAALQPLLDLQARAAQSPRAVADQCATVIVSLPSLDSLRSVVLGDDGVINGKAVKTLINNCTVGAPLIEELTEALGKRGIGLVDCPISGGPPGARAGTLAVMVSGEPALVESVRPLISKWGSVTVAGDKPGLAQVLKLTNNILSAVAMAASADGFVMGAKGGVNPEVLTEAINKGSGRNSATLNKIPTSVLDRSFSYGGPIYILNKDLDLALAQGEALGVPMWVCQAARLVFKHAVFEGMQNSDMTEIVKVVERGARFQLPKTR
jgi:2-hydroxy-3-oxopropionate reductase